MYLLPNYALNETLFLLICLCPCVLTVEEELAYEWRCVEPDLTMQNALCPSGWDAKLAAIYDCTC